MASTAGARPLHLAVITETYPREINGVANTMYELVFGMEGRRVDTQRFSRIGVARICARPGDAVPGTSSFSISGGSRRRRTLS